MGPDNLQTTAPWLSYAQDRRRVSSNRHEGLAGHGVERVAIADPEPSMVGMRGASRLVLRLVRAGHREPARLGTFRPRPGCRASALTVSGGRGEPSVNAARHRRGVPEWPACSNESANQPAHPQGAPP